MPLVPINAQTSAPAGISGLLDALDRLPDGGRVTVMVHGFKFRPGWTGRCPHKHILAADPQSIPGAVSWPRHLGVGPDHVGVAFGWDALGSLWRAWSEAVRAGWALARVLDQLSERGLRADIVAHSLGARVALSGLARARPGSVRSAILIAPAEFRETAQQAIESPAGRQADVINVASRENDLFDAVVEWLLAPHRPGVQALGLGLREPRANWTDLQIDHPETLGALEALGYRVAPPARRICHWSGYLRPGLFPLYRAILSGDLPLPVLRAALPRHLQPRWSRLLEPPWRLPTLPMRRKAAL